MGLIGSVVIGQPIWRHIRFDLAAVVIGCLSTLPLLGLLAYVYRSSAESLIEIRRILHEAIGQRLLHCSWLDLLFLAALAGVSEEFLFRGAFQLWLETYHPYAGLVGCSLLFGLCHAVTPTYAVLATLIGAYLGWMMWWTEPPNLLIPILCHSLYDLVAFVVVRRSSQNLENMASTLQPEN